MLVKKEAKRDLFGINFWQGLLDTHRNLEKKTLQLLKHKHNRYSELRIA